MGSRFWKIKTLLVSALSLDPSNPRLLEPFQITFQFANLEIILLFQIDSIQLLRSIPLKPPLLQSLLPARSNVR